MSVTMLCEQLHELIDTLENKHELIAFLEFFERLKAAKGVERSILIASLREPEELSEEDLEALREAEEDIKAGRLLTHEEFWSEFPDNGVE